MKQLLLILWGRVQCQPVATGTLFHTAIVMACAFGLGWNGNQVAVVSLFTQGLLSWLTYANVTPTAKL